MFLTLGSTCLLLLMVPSSMGQVSWRDYLNNHLDMDTSAVKACWLHNGVIDYVDNALPEKGRICSYSIDVWTHDKKHALEYCESRHPYPIISAEKSGSQTKCAFQISLECEPDWYQANGKCYKIIPASANWRAAKTVCSTQKPASLNPRIAEYYSNSMSLDFSQFYISEVWVSVPSLHDYFVNFGDMNRTDEDSEAALFVLDAAYKYDIKPGTIILADSSEEHNVLCEYTPPMTLAEMYRLAEKYNEIYPFKVSGNQVTFATSSYMTITQTDYVRNSVTKKHSQRFTTDPIKKACMNVGKILNVKSYPLSSYKREYGLVKDQLTDHRFYLSSAYKNDGCSRMNILDNGAPTFSGDNIPGGEAGYCDAHSLSLTKYARYATMAAMRGPAICSLRELSFEYGPCPSGWIQFDRAGGKRFCHYISLPTERVSLEEARVTCNKKGAALTGFETLEEVNAVASQTSNYGSEYLLGGTVPCDVDCRTNDKASWEEGVSRNTVFLNDHPHSSFWTVGNNVNIVSLWGYDFHIHDTGFAPGGWGYICGKYADMVEKSASSVQIGG